MYEYLLLRINMAVLNCIGIKFSHKPFTFTQEIRLAAYSRSILMCVR